MHGVYTLSRMSEVINFRATDEDRKILDKLKKMLGVSAADVIRLAIRLLRDKQAGKGK
jgi:Arc/MetJ-type ribon-helix-helix transcriptional regulator